MTQNPHDPYGTQHPTEEHPYAAGRGQSGAYWGKEQVKLTDQDAYGNPIPQDARLMATLSHLSSLAGVLLSLGILPFFGPLIFWLIYKERPEYAFVSVSSKNAFNFNFTVWIINAVAILAAVFTLGLLVLVPTVTLSLTSLVLAIFHIVGAVKSYQGQVYPYPFKLNILR